MRSARPDGEQRWLPGCAAPAARRIEPWRATKTSRKISQAAGRCQAAKRTTNRTGGPGSPPSSPAAPPGQRGSLPRRSRSSLVFQFVVLAGGLAAPGESVATGGPQPQSAPPAARRPQPSRTPRAPAPAGASPRYLCAGPARRPPVQPEAPNPSPGRGGNGDTPAEVDPGGSRLGPLDPGGPGEAPILGQVDGVLRLPHERLGHGPTSRSPWAEDHVRVPIFVSSPAPIRRAPRGKKGFAAAHAERERNLGPVESQRRQQGADPPSDRGKIRRGEEALSKHRPREIRLASALSVLVRDWGVDGERDAYAHDT